MKQINYYETLKKFLNEDVFYLHIHSIIAIELLDNGNSVSELERIYNSYTNYIKFEYMVYSF